MLPYESLEGNLGLRNILSAERAEDRALEEDLEKGIVRPRKPVQQANGDPEQGGWGRALGIGHSVLSIEH